MLPDDLETLAFGTAQHDLEDDSLTRAVQTLHGCECHKKVRVPDKEKMLNHGTKLATSFAWNLEKSNYNTFVPCMQGNREPELNLLPEFECYIMYVF